MFFLIISSNNLYLLFFFFKMQVSTCMRKSLYMVFNRVNGKCAVRLHKKLTGEDKMKQILLGLLCFYAITVGFVLVVA